MNLTTPSTDLKALQKQNDLFKQLKAEHDKQLKDITKGQDIEQLKARAQKMLLDAKEEAAQIIAKAKRGVEQVEKSKAGYESLKGKLEESSSETQAANDAAKKAKSEAQKAKSEAENLKASLEQSLKDAEKLKADLKGKTKELIDILVQFSGSIN